MSGKEIIARRGRLPDGRQLAWTTERVKNAAGKLMVEIHKGFSLDGRAIDDSDGEAQARAAGLI